MQQDKYTDYVLNGEWNRLMVRAPRRTGKTTLAVALATQVAESGGTVVVVYPCSSQVGTHKQLYPKCSNLCVVSAGRPMCGCEVDLLLMENAAFLQAEDMAALLPMAFGLYRKGRIAAISTWNPDSWFSRTWEEHNQWHKIQLPSPGG